MLSLAASLMLLTSWATTSATSDVMLIPGDVMIGGLLQVFDERCETVRPDSVEIAEAMRWMTSQLNSRNFLRNITIGLHVLPTCGRPEKAATQALELLNSYKPGTSPPLIGILGPALSSETAYVTRVLASLMSRERPPVVSFSVTASDAAAAARETGNFFRVIPPDSIQVEVMAQLLTSLKWNHVALIYEDSLYGRAGAESLRATLEESGAACVRVFESIPVSSTDQQVEARIREILEEVKTARISGLVLFTSGDVTRDILRRVENLGLNYAEFIISEAISLRATLLQTAAGRNLVAANGALVTSPPYRPNQNFSRHWQALLSNRTASHSNPWLSRLPSSGSPDPRQSLFSTYAMTGVVVLAEAVKQLHMHKCSGQPGMCSALGSASREELLQELRRVRVNLFESTFDPDDRTALTFDRDGEANLTNPSEPQYQVFNVQEKAQEFQFVKIGDFRSGQLALNKSEGMVYPESGPSLPLSQASPAQCAEDTDCLQCLPQELHEAVMLVEGDSYVVAVIPIHNNKPGQPLQCGSIRAGISVDLAEAALLAVTKVNQRQGVFQNLLPGRVGLLVIDSCNAPLVLERKMLALHGGTLSLGGGRNSSEIVPKIMGYIGALGSGLSIFMARLLARLGYVQISYASTNDELADRSTYKYFLRLSAPNSQEADAMLSIVKKVGANYIQIVYSEEPYGQSGRDALVSKAPAQGICVANTVGVTETTESHNKVKDELLKKPFAKLVILFVRSHLVEPVMQRMAESGKLRSFHWLASETWGRRNTLLEVPGVAGAITLVQDASQLRELEQHIRNQNLTTTPDPWLSAFWEARLNCYLPGSFRRQGREPCPQDLGTMDPDKFIQDTWAPFVVNSVYALVRGWDAALRKVCGANRLDGKCLELTAPVLYRHMQNVQLDFREAGQFLKVFDSNGDGTGGFAISRVIRKDGKLIYDKEGTWTMESGLVTKLDVKLDSLCPNDEECARCASTPEGSQGSWPCLAPVAGLSTVLAAFVIAFVVSLVCQLTRRNRNPKTENYYDSPSFEDMVPPPRACTGRSKANEHTYLSPTFNREDVGGGEGGKSCTNAVPLDDVSCGEADLADAFDLNQRSGINV